MSRDCSELRRRALRHGEGSPEYDVWVRHSRHCETCRSEVYIQGLLRSETDGDARPGHLPAENIARLMQLAEQRYTGGNHRRRRSLQRLWGWAWRLSGACALACALAGLAIRLELLPHRDDSAQALALINRHLLTRPAADDATAQADVAGEPAASLGDHLFDDELYGAPAGSGLSPEMALLADGLLLAEAADASFAPLARPDTAEPPATPPVPDARELAAAETYSVEPEMLSGWRVDGTIQSCRRRIGRQRERLFQALDEDQVGGLGHAER